MANVKDPQARQKLRQTQRLAAHQVQLMNMVMMPVTDLAQRIKHELEENPALEEGREQEADQASGEELYTSSDYDTGEELSAEEMVRGDYFSEDDIPDHVIQNYAGREGVNPGDIAGAYDLSLRDYLLRELGLSSLSEEQQETAKFLIGSLDEDGYLRRDNQGLLDDLAIYNAVYITEEELKEILRVLKTFDPAGVFAANLRECLLLQLERKPETPAALLAGRILSEEYFEAFSKRHFPQLAASLRVGDAELKEAVELITSLNPSPGLDFGNRLTETLQIVTPDFEVHEVDGELVVTLYRGDLPEVRMSRKFRDSMSHYLGSPKKLTAEEKEVRTFVKNKIFQAQSFVQMLDLRDNALRATMLTIVDLQREYFLTGELQDLKPMILKDVAERTGFDISTISRVTSSKYVATDFGTFPLKHFFTDGTVTDEGEEVSTHRVRELIRRIIDGEDKHAPLSDEAVKALLKDKGLSVARRTIAKYREQMGIPVARLRKEI